jgi:hypothetical protein
MKRPNRRKEARRKTREKQKQTMKIKNNNDMDINISINNNDISIDNNSNRNKNDIQDRTEQRIYDICKEHFGIIADPRFSVTKNINHLLDNYHAADLPRQPNNLKVHNLCADPKSISKPLLDTLGLNLNFGVSIKPRKDNVPIDFERLRRSIRLKYVKFPIKTDIFIPKLHSTSNWPPPNAPKQVENAMDTFEKTTTEAFKKSWKRPHVENLSKIKIDLLKKIKKERKYIVIASDKNLGPCIIEIKEYINRCLTDHLNNSDTYKELPELEARLINDQNFRFICKHFIDNKIATLTEQAKSFFKNEILGMRDGQGIQYKLINITFPYFYAMPKMHKTPWASRPVVSGVCSVMKALSIWLDVQLQSVVHLCPCYLKDSWHFLNDIRNLKDLQGCRLVTADATAMYTNINTDHAIDILDRWFELHRSELPHEYPKELILLGVRRLMSYNVFTFGNRFFLQLNGTAMGTNVACMYATIYYSYHEETNLLHLSYIKFYRRLIDDAFIVIEASTPFTDLESNMNNFGPEGKRLNWEVEQPTSKVDFLDLTITIQEDGTIATKTFQKMMNLYLYRTPESCQPESIVRSFVYGALHRYYWQNTFECDFITFTELLFVRMIDRGHQHCRLVPIFQTAIKKVITSELPNPTLKPPLTDDDDDDNNNDLYIHLPHHPSNPTTQELRSIANNLKETIKSSSNLELDRIIIAYSKAPNIGNLCKRHQMEDYIDTHYT